MLQRVWLTRERESDVWKPLRKVDCKALNESRGEEVVVDGGRATADPRGGTVRANYVSRPVTRLIPATWFQREEKKKNDKEFVLVPLPEADAWQVELLYQNAVRAASSLGEGIDEILKEEVVLETQPEYKVCVVRNHGGMLCMRKKPRKSAFLGIGEVQFTLQRGYGQYTIEGEDDENALGDLTHCVFVVHGIGETMWSRQESSTSSIREDVDQVRSTVNRKKVLAWRDECKRCERQKKPPPPPPNRIEFIPIEWYDRVRSPSHSLVESLRAVTINSIPALRAIANDVIFDVLMYLTPEYCGAILECVTSQIIELYSTFQRINPAFVGDGGKMSLMGHSLGSVIVWDILSVLRESLEGKVPRGTADDPIRIDVPPSPPQSGDRSRSAASAATAGLDVLQGTKKWGPPLPRKMNKVIPFVPDLTIFLGSPVGLFLTLRGAHSAFDELRAVAEAERASLIPCDDEEVEVLGGGGNRKSNEPPPVFNLSPIICSPFALPTGSLFNVFHPSDPVAYRIEPLLLPEGVPPNEFPPPAFLSPDGKTIRLHTKARQVGNELFRQFGSLSSLIGKSVESAAESAAEADRASRERGDGGPTAGGGAQRQNLSGLVRDRDVSFRLGGPSGRVDYQLQLGKCPRLCLSLLRTSLTPLLH